MFFTEQSLLVKLEAAFADSILWNHVSYIPGFGIRCATITTVKCRKPSIRKPWILVEEIKSGRSCLNFIVVNFSDVKQKVDFNYIYDSMIFLHDSHHSFMKVLFCVRMYNTLTINQAMLAYLQYLRFAFQIYPMNG